VEDLDRQVLALLTEYLLDLLGTNLACPVVRVDDVVPELELDELDLDLDLHIDLAIPIDIAVHFRIVDLEVGLGGVGVELILEQVCFSCFGNGVLLD
jgi:hypothetical protein